MIALKNVSIKFGDQPVFSGLDYSFAEGAITAIRKMGVLDGGSTLLKCCAGIMVPTAGTILYRGENLAQMSAHQRYRALCYCYESGGLVSLFTVYNNLAIPLLFHQVLEEHEIEPRIHAVAEQLGIESLLDLEPFQLNDVQTRLVNLARALVINADVVLIDELQTGMSAEMLASVVALLQARAQQGASILMVTTDGHEDGFAHVHLAIRNRRLEPRL